MGRVGRPHPRPPTGSRARSTPPRSTWLSSSTNSPGPFEYVPLPKFPAVVRDLSFLVDRTVPYQEIKPRRSRSCRFPISKSFGIIDRYAGETIPQDKASLSLRFVYRNPKATLTTEDVDKAEQKLLMALKAALKIQLREGGPA